MFKTYSLEVGGRTLSVDIDRIGKQAGGCAFMHYGDTTVSCFATASEKPRDGIDFFPLSVEYTYNRFLLCNGFREAPRRDRLFPAQRGIH